MPSSQAQSPKISIIVACYNGAKTLQRCIDSIASQSYDNRELIIIDGASTDASVNILKHKAKEISHWKSEPDAGIYSAWNKALEHVTGDWICFLGADDHFFSSETLKQAADQLSSAYPSYRVVYGKVALTDSQGETIETIGKPWEQIFELFRHEMTLSHQGVFHHRELFSEHGKFDESFRISGDYEFLLRELKTKNAKFLSELTVAKMQIGGVSSLQNQYKIILQELRRARIKNGLTDFSKPLFWRETKAKTQQILQKLLGRRTVNYITDIYRVATGRPRIWTRQW